MCRLADDYHPRQWSDVIGQDKALAVLERLRKRGLSGRAYFLAGPKGTGKNSIADLLAREVSEPSMVTHWNAKELTSENIEELRDAKRRRPVIGPGYCYIVDEVHVLRNEVVTQLLNVCERMPAWLTVIFTTTAEAKASLFDEKIDASPFLERCEELPMAQRDLCDVFARHLVAVGRREGLLNGRPDEYYLERSKRILKENRNSLRAGYRALETGKLTASDEGADHE